MWWPEKTKFTVAGSSLISSDSAAAAMLSKLGPGVPSSMLEAVFTGGGKEHAPHAAPGQHSYREARCPIVSIDRFQFRSSDGGSGAVGINVTLAEPCYSRARTLSSCSTPSYISNSRQLLLDGAAVPGSFFFFGVDDPDWRHRDECLRVSFTMPDEVVRDGFRIIADEVAKAYAHSSC